jgi:PAS domain-containing protein
MCAAVLEPNDLLRDAIDANPSFMLVVDDDVRIVDYNRAAAALLGDSRRLVLRRRGGEMLHCIHAEDSPEGCGRGPFCKDCVVRNSVHAAVAGQRIVRARVKLELAGPEAAANYHGLITASPFQYRGDQLVLLVIEDINELVALRRIIPICPACRQVRQDPEFWTDVEAYFSGHLDVDFRYCVCPACQEEMGGEREEY